MPRTPRSRRNADRSVEALRHDDDRRPNIPTAEDQPLVAPEDRAPRPTAYQRRNRDLDPQLVWRGKDEQDLADLTVNAPPIYIQEKVHPQALIADLAAQTKASRAAEEPQTVDMFADFNGLPEGAERTEFYQHEGYWQNRLILGDSLQVMASLSHREGLQGKVQCIYIDPPYGIRFNSNFQWSTTSRDVRDGNRAHITREPEQVKAFRDTWRDGIHSYLSYLRDRLTVARDLLADSGSCFVQIGDENVHRVRAVMDEVFGEENFVSQINFAKTTGFSGESLSNVSDHILWYSRDLSYLKYRPIWKDKVVGEEGAGSYRPVGSIGSLIKKIFDPTRLATLADLTSQGESENDQPLFVDGKRFLPRKGMHWKTTTEGIHRLTKAGRVAALQNTPSYVRFLDDFRVFPLVNIWTDTVGQNQFGGSKMYVVQTALPVLERCILMTSDPGDLVLDPTCGSGTTAYVAEQWGRRWVTIDTSRVALALARARIMGARYPWYILADSPEGQRKEAELSRRLPSEMPTYGKLRQGFVYRRVPHITLRAIANNAEIDVIWEQHQAGLEPLRQRLNAALQQTWQEWEIPREAEAAWPEAAKDWHRQWWEQRIARQQEIDAAIAARADYEYLYDQPCEDRRKVRVAGPFTVESISPHRVLGVDENGDVIDRVAEAAGPYSTGYDFGRVMLDTLKQSGVQQAHKEDRITFTSLEPRSGKLVCAEGRYIEGAGGDEEDGGAAEASAGRERRAGIFIGPEFGTVSRPDLVEAAQEAAEAGFDVLIACAFNYDAHSAELERLGSIPVLKARMNADLHMAGELKNTGKGNLFVIFGEPDVDLLDCPDGKIQVRVNGVDVFHPNTGEIRSDDPDGIACWFIDTDYNQESFFVRHAYFLGAGDPYKALKTTLRAEIDADAWATLHSAISRPFVKPASGRIAVKVINHLGDEALKVLRAG